MNMIGKLTRLFSDERFEVKISSAQPLNQLTR